MNIKNDKNDININLRENNSQIDIERFMPLTESEKEENNIIRSLVVDDNQLYLDSGYCLAKIDIKINNKFGLYYHAIKTNNIDEFIESVRTFLKAANVELTSNDVNNLRAEYGKF